MDPLREGSLRQPKVEVLMSRHPQEFAFLTQVGDEDDTRGKIETFHGIGHYSDFQRGTLSDLTIRASNAREWTVHKAVVVKGCEFFVHAVMSNFKETHTNVIEMVNDDPAAINALLEYLYVGDYSIPRLYGLQLLMMHTEVYIIGAIYCVPGLQELAYRRLVRLWLSKGVFCHGMAPFIVKRIYEALPDTDTSLRMREFLSCMSAIHLPGLLVQPMFGNLMATFSAFREDVANALVKVDTGRKCRACCHRVMRLPYMVVERVPLKRKHSEIH
ncbi:hypothetical protein HDK77DRAFT_429278 [Phyllosticta capitalensis]|uniref:BTB domain-containing protein n=1 Tax=Phyllosticta capitalensis TaxID=121624 RepID=A0ABR1YJ64_9PEZI